METTFGKTVETRLIDNYTSSSFKDYKTKNRKQNFECELQIATENIFNLQNNKQFQINYLKLQKYKHELLYLKLKQHNQKQAELEKRSNQQCYSSVLSRKNYQHLINSGPTGYLSDNEFNNSIKSPYDTIRQYSYVQNQVLDDDTRSCVSVRSSYDSRYAEIKNSRYKSLERSRHSSSFRPQKYNFNQKIQDNLTWKNFNYIPDNVSKFNENSEIKKCPSYTSNKAVIKKNKSISTPGTPLLSSSLNKKIVNNDLLCNKFNDENDKIMLRQKEIEIQLKNIENLRNQKFFQEENHKIESNTKTFKNIEPNSDKSQLEVVSLENALLSMNEILKNLTINSKKKADCEEVSTCKHELSPPLSTSTSFSSATNEKRKTQIELLTPASSISPSSSSDYSNSSSIINESKIKNNVSFSPSVSSNSCTNSLFSRNSISENVDNGMVVKKNSIEIADFSKLTKNDENNKKLKSLSFRKRIKKIFFSNN